MTKSSGGRRTARHALERRLFGLPAGAGAAEAISYRDALDRVARITTLLQLQQLVERAGSTGDVILLRAALRHAFRRARRPSAADDWFRLIVEHGTRPTAAVSPIVSAADLERLGALVDRDATAEQHPGSESSDPSRPTTSGDPA